MTDIVVNVTGREQGIVVGLSPSGALVQRNTPITLKNSVQNVTRLDGLLDVVPDTAATANGSTLVYDSSTDKYVVKELDLDGGTF